MGLLTWICIGIDAIIALFFIVMLFNPKQDAAGKGMLFLPVIVLLACAAGSWWLMQRHYAVSALLLSAVPAVVAVYVLYLSVRK